MLLSEAVKGLDIISVKGNLDIEITDIQ